MKSKLDLAVVGGGLGGLSSAIHLAARGHRVTLFEKNDVVGGKAGRFESQGYSFDTGPSLLTMPESIDDLFRAAGGDREAELPLVRLPIQCRYFFEDGRQLDIHDDRAATLAAVEKFSPAESARFGRMLDASRSVYEITGRPFLEKPFESFWSFSASFRGKLVPTLRWALLEGSLGDVTRRLLKEDALRWLVHRYATYAGGGPARTPASYTMVLHVETAGGAWYPRGGIRSIVVALEKLARRVGVHIRTGASVDRIEVEGHRVVGVREHGRLDRFDAVVSNADPVFVADRLLEPSAARRSGLRKHLRQDLSLSAVVVMLGVKGRLDHLAHHNVMFPKHYPEEFRDLFDREEPPEDPTIYLCIPSRTEAGRAPDGCESVFALINAPATSGRADWQAKRPVIQERIKAALERRLIPDLRSRIEVEEWVGPDELRGRFNAPGGTIYGVTPHGRFSPFHRPMPRAPGLRGLYFAGGGTHPGAGIPLVVRSGQFAAELIERDLAAGRLMSRQVALPPPNEPLPQVPTG